MAGAFELLHPTVQRKLWDMKWTELRPIQVDAIQHLLAQTPTDCIIASPTASGKTEAAFLPVLSTIADDPGGGVRAMYIGPLKALINDQFGRIEQLCERMEMPVCRWHGDVEDGPRKALLARPAGILLITPESLEAMFVLRPTQIPALFGRLGYVVIDEMHAFLGTPRGAQLISQLHRLRLRAGADPIRIGLSATLGDPAAARRWLRRDGRPVRVIESPADGSEIRMKLRGLWRHSDGPDEDEDPAIAEIARGILVACHGKTNLVFANSKSQIEALADELATQASAMSLPDEIVVHHGSLSKEEREHAEDRLRSGHACTAVCSNTLELGIDIGAIDEVVQVSPPWSVASLVQRLGRSGRRAGAARILRGYFVEDVPEADATEWDRLHLDFIRGLGTFELMLEHWLESPSVDRANLSTLVQQTLSILAETGGIRAHELYPRLSESGAFFGVQRSSFAMLLRELGARDLIEQLPDASLVLGLKGQRIVEHYSFYAAFKAPSEFLVVYRDQAIGTLPETMLPAAGEHVILAGRRWLVEEIDPDRHVVYVSPGRGRRPPGFISGRPDTDVVVHARMRRLLATDEVPRYLDDTAKVILQRARTNARASELASVVRVLPDRTVLSLWAGTRIHRTLLLVLISAGARVASASDVALEVFASPEEWLPILRRFVANPDGPALARCAEDRLFARMTDGEKFDVFLPSELWRNSYARERLDLEGAMRIATRIIAEASRISHVVAPAAVNAPVVAISGLRAWAEAVTSLSVREPLPTRLVLVPSEAHAHALRVELATRSPHVLAGTRFFTAAAAARAVLDHAGIAYTLGEEVRRPLRLRKVLRTSPALQTYRLDDLGTRGWEDAFASTIEQLESSALRPEDLERLGEPRASDLVAIWRALDADAGTSWTVPRVIAEAAIVLARAPNYWPFDAPVLADVTAGIDAAHARLLRQIPNMTCGVLSARPARRAMLDRMHALLGRDVADALAAVETPEPRDGELGILSELLFEPPERLTAPARRRSSGPDDTVSLELHAGVDEELDAAVRWVAEEVFDRRTRLQDIAILVPTPDPLTTLIADRLRTLSWPDDVEPVYVACGRPATATAAGARLLALFDALASYLPADAVAELVPRLRFADGAGGGRSLSPGLARSVVGLIATSGGSGVRPDGALAWRDCLRRAEATLRWRERGESPRLGEHVRSIAPALEALSAIASEMIAGAELRPLWDAIAAFVSSHLVAPAQMAAILTELGADLASLAADRVTDGIIGVDAVALMVERLRALRLHAGRYGDPSIYVGTVTGAAGLPFVAVRVLGLAEGAFPGTMREDALLPSELRRRLPSFAMPSDDEYATARLHAFDRLVREAKRRVALSAPRTDLDGSEREPAGVFVEAAAALGRPNAITGEPGRGVPTSTELERDAFRGARVAMTARRALSPLCPADWLHVVAVDRCDLPSVWSRVTVTDPRAVVERAGTMGGLLGPAPLTRDVPGLSPERPLSASALRVLLACPQRFLLERILGFWARAEASPTHRIDPAAYGDLVHRVAEAFARAHGPPFGAREHDLAHWLGLADTIACAVFDDFLSSYPLAGEAVIEGEQRRLRRDVGALIAEDWGDGRPRAFVAAEREFGPIALPTDGAPLFVTGRIDRIDLEGAVTLVRDFKTGRARPRERDQVGPEVEIDLQLAVYMAVSKQLAPAWGVPADVAGAYVYVDAFAPHRERAFRGDRLALDAAGRTWFELGASLIREQAYVRTPDSDDCRSCPFSPVCGDRAPETAVQLRDAGGAPGVFRDLKR